MNFSCYKQNQKLRSRSMTHCYQECPLPSLLEADRKAITGTGVGDFNNILASMRKVFLFPFK